jgi:hypothetical protein
MINVQVQVVNFGGFENVVQAVFSKGNCGPNILWSRETVFINNEIFQVSEVFPVFNFPVTRHYSEITETCFVKVKIELFTNSSRTIKCDEGTSENILVEIPTPQGFRKINGSSLFVFIGENKIAKTTGYNLSIEMSQLDSTSNESGFFADHIPHIARWTLTSDSLLIYDGYSYGNIYDAFINRERVWLSIGDETNYTLIGLALIASLSKSGPLEAVPSISVEFTGVGELYPSTTPFESFIIDELLERIIDQDSNFLIYT